MKILHTLFCRLTGRHDAKNLGIQLLRRENGQTRLVLRVRCVRCGKEYDVNV